jgi:NAD-dependent deacetylase
VPEIERAEAIVQTADVLIVVGTSLKVYPAAGLTRYAAAHCQKYLVDPEIPDPALQDEFTCIAEPAGSALPKLIPRL